MNGGRGDRRSVAQPTKQCSALVQSSGNTGEVISDHRRRLSQPARCACIMRGSRKTLRSRRWNRKSRNYAAAPGRFARKTSPARTARSCSTGRWIGVERVEGIEPSWLAWKARTLPLSYTRITQGFWWKGLDSNQRRRTPADLQSAPFSHSGTLPAKIAHQDHRGSGS